MNDPTVPNPSERKKIMFYDSEFRQAKLKIRCEFDGLSQSQFFRMMVTGYIENDDRVHSFLEECKEKYQIQGQQKRKKVQESRRNVDLVESKFALKEEEIENIFDLIETETNL